MSIQQELAASELTDLLFEEPGIGRCLVAPDGTVLRANREWLRSTGFSLDEVLGADVVALFAESRDLAMALHARARAGHPVAVPCHAQRIGGRLTWWEGSIAPVPMEGGNGLLITARELVPGWDAPPHDDRSPPLSTAQRQLAAAERLHALSIQLIQADDIQALYERVLDTAVAIMAADFASIQMLDQVRGELLLLGHRGFSAEADRLWKSVRPESRSVCGMALRLVERVVVPDVQRCESLAGSADLEVMARNGIRAVQSTPLLSRSGVLIGMISTHWRAPHTPAPGDLRMLDLLARQAADLIDRKRTEAALVEADRRKTEFLAVLSHELRNPLSTIRNGIQLLERAAPGSEQAGRAGQIIRRQTDHLARLVDDLLDVARISRGKIRLQPRLVDLREIVRRTASDHLPLFEQGQLELRVELAAAPVWVIADEVRIAQVVANLLHNAAKFTPAGGAVTVGVSGGSSAEITLRDSGAGMEPGEIERMWEPFAQADRSLARTKGGLGLGLALVKALVELHGGTVRAGSDGPGRGAEFIVTLPLAEQEPALPAAPRGESHAQGSLLVLVIEDNVDAGQSLADLLELQGHRVRVARDGRSGLALARETRPDVVLCDIGLPDVSGFDVAREMRREDCLRSTRIIALSGYAQDEDQRRAREAGFDAHVPKPLDVEELAKTLARGA